MICHIHGRGGSTRGGLPDQRRRDARPGPCVRLPALDVV